MKAILIFVSACVLGVPGVLYAEVIFFGPTPYLSLADSPFDTSGLGTTFFLEDFEDGNLDLPSNVEPYPGIVSFPSLVADSVDADDGLVDGSGSRAFAFSPTLVGMTFSVPPIWQTAFGLVFDERQLPTHAGLVITDGLPTSKIIFETIDANFHESHMQYLSWPFDGRTDGTTAEDRFIGVSNPSGIRSVRVTHSYTGFTYENRFEIDHIQFGNYVPEPFLGRFAILVAIFVCVRRLCANSFII